jgi:hypothetical protein
LFATTPLFELFVYSAIWREKMGMKKEIAREMEMGSES